MRTDRVGVPPHLFKVAISVNSTIPGFSPSLMLETCAPLLAHVHALLVPVVFTKGGGGILNNSGLLQPAL